MKSLQNPESAKSSHVEMEENFRHHEEDADGTSGLSQEDIDFLESFPPDRKRRVIRKVDVSFS